MKYVEKDKAYKIVLHYGSYAASAKVADLPSIDLVRCKECIHFTQSGWCDREFDWFPVDENDFCSMAEKMEAQDGQ